MKNILPLISLILLFANCSSDDDNGAFAELSENRVLWRSQQITDYSWNERIFCFCAGPLEWDVFVVNTEKDSVDFDTVGIPPEDMAEVREYVFNNAHTVEAAFDKIEELLSRDVASLVVSYDATYGFPTSISVDYILNAVDDEITYRFTEFEISD